jgi:hypothetical protein
MKSEQERYNDLSLIDENNPVQIKKVREFLISFRDNNYNEYRKGRFEFQIFSNCISLLAKKLIEMNEEF